MRITIDHCTVFVILSIVLVISGLFSHGLLTSKDTAPTAKSADQEFSTDGMFPSKMHFQDSKGKDKYVYKIVNPFWACDSDGHHTIMFNDDTCGLDKPCVFPTHTDNIVDGLGAVTEKKWIRVTTVDGKVYDWGVKYSWGNIMNGP